MSQVKVVVDINEAQKKVAKLPPLLQTLRLTARKQIAALVQDLFNNTDDALFELADRSQSDLQQEMYFDSMREIRLHRASIAENFNEYFMESWQLLLEAPASETSTTSELSIDGDEPHYSLLGQDALEMSVAVAGIVSKVTSLQSLPIMHLTKRLSAVLAPRVVTERTNPIGPHALSTSFSDALATLDLGIKVHIIIMKLFERFVMERMGPVYGLLNQQLIDADVLPDLTRGIIKGKSTSSPAHGGRAGTAGIGSEATQSSGPNTGIGGPQGRGSMSNATPASSGKGQTGERETSSGQGGVDDFGFGTVQNLLAQIRQAGATVPGAVLNERQPHAPELSAHELLTLLNNAQQQVGNSALNIEEVPTVANIYGLVKAASPDKSKNLEQADDDTVNFIGLLFDYILNDRNLAIPMKALISRLQIPILKLALIDKSFFSRSAHPARALLNDLSSAGIGWSSTKELKRDKLYNKIEAVVHTVLNDFQNNPKIFEEILSDFREFTSRDNRRNLLVEQRVKDTEQGKARTQQAKLAVQKVINQKASGMRLPQELGRFISETWSRALTLIYVKHGTQSPYWTAGVTTLDDLLWVMQPLSDIEDVERRESLKNPLTLQIRDAMHDLGCPEEEVKRFTTWLSDHLDLLSNNDRAYLEVDEREELPTPTAIVEDIVLSSIKEIPDTELNPKTLQELKALTEGAWVELSEDGNTPVRCKLATVTQPGQNYVFVNKRGMKVAEKNRLQLAGLLEDDCLKLIDESQVFDRALQSVISNLRDIQRSRPKNR